MNKIDELEKSLNIMMGRVNALQGLLYVIARELPPELAEATANNAKIACEKVIADMTATPIPDEMMNETRRVFQEGIRVLASAARQDPK